MRALDSRRRQTAIRQEQRRHPNNKIKVLGRRFIWIQPGDPPHAIDVGVGALRSRIDDLQRRRRQFRLLALLLDCRRQELLLLGLGDRFRFFLEEPAPRTMTMPTASGGLCRFRRLRWRRSTYW